MDVTPNSREGCRLRRAEMVPRIRELTERGMFPAAIGPLLGTTNHTVKRAAEEAGLTLNRSRRPRTNLPDPEPPPPGLSLSQRAAYCRRAYAAGHTFAAIGRVLGLSKARVGQICSHDAYRRRRPR